MTSSTKFLLSEEKIKLVFQKADIHDIVSINELTAGEFNAIYSVSTKNNEYVVKVAPSNASSILTYEKKMIEQEVAFYNILSENTDIRVPKIYFTDFSEKIIPAKYFIMEKISGVTLDKAKLNGDDKAKVQELIAEMLAKMHTIKSIEFGYAQNGFENNWYLALKKMVKNLEKDCRAKGKSFKQGKILMGHIEKHKNILKKVDGCCVNYDLGDKNLFYNKVGGEIQLTLIDPERGFFGDLISDFVCLDVMKMGLEKKTTAIANYNKHATKPVTPTKEEKIRYYIMSCVLFLIMYTEKFYRYKLYNFGYWRNVVAGRMFWNAGLKGLKSNENQHGQKNHIDVK